MSAILFAMLSFAGVHGNVTVDIVDPAAYAAPTVVHYSPGFPEDDATTVCADRGGSFVDDAAERFVCVVD